MSTTGSSFSVLREVLNTEIVRGELFVKPPSQPVLGITAIVGVTGQIEGRVLLDMNPTTGLNIASSMNEMEMSEFDELAKATIAELANMIVARALTKLDENGFEVDLSPPSLFTGDDMDNTNTAEEALIVPIEMPLGRVEINLTMRERALSV